MSSNEEADEFPSLAKDFDKQLNAFHSIEDSNLQSNSSDYQIQVADCISKLEKMTLQISQLGIFSSNEKFSELSTSSLKFLLLPVLLGSLTMKQIGILSREDILKIASIYFKDFLSRCKEYELTNIEVPVSIVNDVEEDKVEETSSDAINVSSTRKGMPSPKELQRMAMQRTEKIERFKEAKTITEKLKELKKTLENPSCDEDVLRDFYIMMINQFIYKSLDELDAIIMEQNMLNQMKTVGKKEEYDDHKNPMQKPLRPFLITKDQAQKSVFGAGYPSLPVMSIDEFYEQRVKEDWFIAKSEAIHKENSGSSDSQKKNEKHGKDEELDEDVERLRQRDEWRDDHRRGWGNTYNRS